MTALLLRSTGYIIDTMSFDIERFQQVLRLISKDLTAAPASLSTNTTSVKEEPLIVTKPKRCQHTECNKKIMLTDFACKCKGWYCGTHRYSESHRCQFDYKESSRELLEKRMSKVVGQKLEHI